MKKTRQNKKLAGRPASGGVVRRRTEFLRLALAENGGRLSGQGREHQRDHVIEPLVPRFLGQEIAAEDRRRLEQALTNLPPRQKAAIALTWR